jgi:alanine dehydrogenase
MKGRRMLVGVPKEIKNHEYRVGLVPASVRKVVERGHSVLIETGAGEGIDFSDADYQAMGATIAKTGDEVFAQADLVVKVKEPQALERRRLRNGQALFTFLHLAPDPEQAKDLVESGAICIAYETVTSPNGGLPLLAPMSEIAGRMSIQAGAHCLEKAQGGRGVLLSGVPGAAAAKVVVLGGGVVGANAIAMAMGLGADVTVLDANEDVLRSLIGRFGPTLRCAAASDKTIEEKVLGADLVIGAVLIPGAHAPRLISAEMVKRMKHGAVLVDVSIDQGGCFETSHQTTHESPTFITDQVVHYCVGNMPGAVPRTSTFALNNVILPYVLSLVEKGYRRALAEDPHFLAGLNVCTGRITCPGVAESLGYPLTDAKAAIEAADGELV